MTEGKSGWIIGGPGSIAADLVDILSSGPGSSESPGGSSSIDWRLHQEPVLPGVAANDIVIYLAAYRSSNGQPSSAEALRLLEKVDKADGSRCVIVASTAVYEPGPHHPGLARSAEWPNSRRSNPISLAWREFEDTVSASPDAANRTVLRVPPLVEDRRGRYSNPGVGPLFRGLLSWVPLGFDPPIQWITITQLGRVLRRLLAAAPPSTPALSNVALSTQTARLRVVLRQLGRRPIPVPATLLRVIDRLRSRVGTTDYRRYPYTVFGDPISEKALLSPPTDSEPALTGDADDYGQDKTYISRLSRTLFKSLHDVYWRVELEGIDHVPRQGGGVLVGMHRGFQPWDAVMTLHAIVTQRGRYPRFLIHPTLVKFPFLEPYMRKLGGLLANQDNADWVLDRGQLLGVYPEGIRGAFTLYRNAYRIRRLGRGEFVTMAIQHQVPIIPFVTVGSAEIFPIWKRFRWSSFTRYTLWPYFPITTPLPLPSKWHTEFLTPIETKGHYSVDSANDPQTIAKVHDLVLNQMRLSLQSMISRRPGRFWGTVFDQPRREDSP